MIAPTRPVDPDSGFRRRLGKRSAGRFRTELGKGTTFSRAVGAAKTIAALAAEGQLRAQTLRPVHSEWRETRHEESAACRAAAPPADKTGEEKK